MNQNWIHWWVKRSTLEYDYTTKSAVLNKGLHCLWTTYLTTIRPCKIRMVLSGFSAAHDKMTWTHGLKRKPQKCFCMTFAKLIGISDIQELMEIEVVCS